jgi:hypothetical protein
MVEKVQVIKEKLDHSGIFDFAAFYGYAHSWFKNELYGVVEEKYSEKVSGGARDISIEWKAIKFISDYFRFEHVIKMEVAGLTDVEVEIEGKKRKMNKGKIAIEIKGVLIKDPGSKWEESKFLQFWREVYDKYIIRSRVDVMENKAMDDVRDWKDAMKAYLELTGKR